jgi:type II secretory pathway component PulK
MTNPSQKNGVALLMVLMSLVLLGVLLFEVSGASRVDLSISRNARDRLQAYYLAQSGMRMALLRLQAYQVAYNMASSGQIPENFRSAVTQVWSSPLPPFPLPGKDNELNWPGQFSFRIDSESAKIPINMLDGDDWRGSSPEMRDNVATQLEAYIKGLQDDEDFQEEFPDLEASDVVNAIRDWIDSDSSKQGGGDEIQDYDRLEPPIRPRNNRIPTLTELHMVRGMTDRFYARLVKNLSVVNLSTQVSANSLSLERIKSLHPPLTQEDLAAIAKQRQETPFASLKELENFINTSPDVRNGRGFVMPDWLKDSKAERFFWAESTGTVGDSRRTLRLGIRFDEKPTKPGESGQNTATLEPLRVIIVEEGGL